MTSSRHQPGGTSGRSSRTTSPLDTFYLVPLDVYSGEFPKSTEQQVHGGLLSLVTNQPLDAVPTDLVVTTGTGKLVIVINAGTDVAGEITVTGTSVDRETGAETASDTDTITVDALTTDASDTDANSNVRHAFTGAYITSKWFTGSVTLSTADLTLTDVDVWHCSFEQVNDTPQFVLDTLDINLFVSNATAELDAYLYSIEVTGDKVDITREASINVTGVTADRFERKRIGNIGKALSGTTDGLFVDMFGGPTASFIEEVTVKVWVKIIGGATDVTLVGTDRVAGPSSATDNAAARWDGTTGKLLQDSTVTITDGGIVTIDDGSANQIVITPSSSSPKIEMNAVVALNFQPANNLLNIGAPGTTVGFPSSATNAPMYVVERSAAPTDPFANDIYLDNGTNTASGVPGWRRYTGAAWEDIGATAGGGLSTGDQIADIMAVFDPDNSSDDAAHVTKEDGGGGSNPAEQYRVISFDDSVDEYQDFLVRFYDQYSPAASGDVLTVRLPWSAETATTNNVEWVVSFRRANFDGEDMTAAFNYSTLAQSVVDTAPGTQGQITQALVSFTKAESDAIVGGELAIMRVSRDITPSSGSNMSDDAYLWPAVQVVMA